MTLRRTVGAALAAVSVAIGVAGTPGAAAAPPGIPIPAETVASLAGRFRAAVNALETGNCALWLSLSALRHRNCGLFWVRAVLFSNARPWTNYRGRGARTQAIACRAVFGPPESALVSDLKANPDVQPTHFGGTRDWHFFGLRTPRHYYNFVVAHYADAPGSRSKYFVDPPVRVF